MHEMHEKYFKTPQNILTKILPDKKDFKARNYAFVLIAGNIIYAL